MQYKCIIKTCKNYPSDIVSMLGMKLSVCVEHHEALFELTKQSDEEYINLQRKYFQAAHNLRGD